MKRNSGSTRWEWMCLNCGEQVARNLAWCLKCYISKFATTEEDLQEIELLREERIARRGNKRRLRDTS